MSALHTRPVCASDMLPTGRITLAPPRLPSGIELPECPPGRWFEAASAEPDEQRDTERVSCPHFCDCDDCLNGQSGFDESDPFERRLARELEHRRGLPLGDPERAEDS